MLPLAAALLAPFEQESVVIAELRRRAEATSIRLYLLTPREHESLASTNRVRPPRHRYRRRFLPRFDWRG